MKRFPILLSLIFAFLFNIKAQTVIHSENFNTTTSGSWTAVDSANASPTDVWRFATGNAQINGFGDENDVDWLISPVINMDNSTNETFSFKSINRYAGTTTGTSPNINLELKYTKNYTGDLATTTWIDIPLPPSVSASNNTTATLSAQTTHVPFDISTISGVNVRFAFRYYGLMTASKEWQIDDIEISGIRPCTVPTTQPTALTGVAGKTTANLSWTSGNGTKTLVLINTTNTFTNPVNGTTYTANAVYAGTGQQVIYNGINALTIVSGLTASTPYYIQAFTVSDCASPVTYLTASPAVANFTTQSATASGEPTGYYNAAVGLTCAAKKNALQTVITNGFTSISYTPGLWNAYPSTDAKLNDAGTATVVWDMYSDNPTGPDPYTFTFVVDQDNGTLGTSEGQKFNREHTVPQSWFVKASPMVSDLFIVYPTDKYVNGVRGNVPYGEVGTASFTSLNGSKFGVSKISGINGNVFEPIDAYKGDFARNYFYTATRYGSLIGSWATNTAESAIVLDGTNYPAYKIPFLQMLIKWHTQDPVSAKERDRNNAVFAIQGNRNPFIDHPEYVNEVWGTCGLALPD